MGYILPLCSTYSHIFTKCWGTDVCICKRQTAQINCITEVVLNRRGTALKYHMQKQPRIDGKFRKPHFIIPSSELIELPHPVSTSATLTDAEQPVHRMSAFKFTPSLSFRSSCDLLNKCSHFISVLHHCFSKHLSRGCNSQAGGVEVKYTW